MFVQRKFSGVEHITDLSYIEFKRDGTQESAVTHIVDDENGIVITLIGKVRVTKFFNTIKNC